MKYKLINQQDYEDCGWACLAMMIEHHQQKRFSLYELKNKYNSNKHGLSFFDLATFAKDFKLDSKGYEADIEMLEQNNHQMPFILNVTNEFGTGHFVILNKIENGQAWIFDPAKVKPEVLTLEQLSEIYLSKILIFQKKGKLKFTLNKDKIWLTLKQEIPSLIILSVLAIIYHFLWLWTSKFIMEFSHWTVQQKINYQHLGMFILMAFSSIVIEFFYHWVKMQIFNHFYLKTFKFTITNLRYKNKGIEELVITDEFKNMHDLIKINFLMMETLINFFAFFSIGIVCLIWIWKINSSLVLFVLLMVAILLVSKIWFSLTIEKFQNKKQYQEKNVNQNLGQFVRDYKLIKERQLDQNFEQQIVKAMGENTKINNYVQTLGNGDNLFYKLMNKIIYFFLFVVMFTLLEKGTLNFFNVIYVSIISSFFLNLAIQSLNPLIKLFILRKDFHLFETYFVEIKKSLFKITQTKMLDDPSEIEMIYQQATQNQEIYVLANNEQLIYSTASENIFLGNKDIDPNLFNTLDLMNLLKEHEIDWLMDQTLMSNQQKQLINFLALFFVKQTQFVLVEPLAAFSKEVREHYLELLTQLRPDSKYICYTKI